MTTNTVMADRPMGPRIATLILLLILGFPHPLWASTLTVEPDEKTYHFVSHYRVVIDATATTVWKHLVNLGSWMYEFEMDSVSGDPGKEGEVLRLYATQDFYVQITRTVPNELLVIVNLPSTFRGESSTGVGVISLHEVSGHTTVDLTMIRRYTWQGDGINPMKRTRESQVFVESTRAMWQDRFLEKLRSLAENT